MAKRYFSIVIVYVLCQLAGFLAYTPLLSFIPAHQRAGVMVLTTFLICLIVSIILLWPERHIKWPPMESGKLISWSIGGIFLVYFTQIIAGIIDLNVFGGPAQSQNTQDIMRLAHQSPYILLVVVIIGPILEEIIFRKIIFGSLNKVMHFWFAAIISALLFAVAHNDGHLIIYGSIGLVLAYLYHKTKRIYVSMIAHASLNGIATILALSPQVQHILQKSQSGWIHWWF